MIDPCREHRRKIRCRCCRRPFLISVYSCIDAQKLPWAKPDIMGGRFFRRNCPHCGTENDFLYAMTYLDGCERIIIRFHTRDLPESGTLPVPLPVSPNGPKPWRCRNVVGWSEFLEKIRIFDAGLNDFQLEAVKLFLCRAHRYPDLEFLARSGTTLIFNVPGSTESGCELAAVDEMTWRAVLEKFGDSFLNAVSFVRVNRVLIQKILSSRLENSL